MAEKKSEKLERTYNVPLRKGVMRTPKYRRAKKAIYELKKFLERHMKPTELKLGRYLNLEIWKHGIKNFPHHVKVTCVKDEKGVVIAELFGAPKDVKIEIKDIKDTKEKEVKAEIVSEKSSEQKEKSKEETAKEIQKEEIKELQKEKPKVHHKPKENKAPTQKIKKKEFLGDDKGN